MLNYILRGEQFEDAGGIFWTWKRILSGQLFDTEGIWLPTRLIVFQGVQFVVSVIMIYIFFTVTKFAADQAEDAQAKLDPDLPDWVKRCARRFPAPLVVVHSQNPLLTSGCLCLLCCFTKNRSNSSSCQRGALPGVRGRNLRHHYSVSDIHSVCNFYLDTLPVWSNSLPRFSLFPQVQNKS